MLTGVAYCAVFLLAGFIFDLFAMRQHPERVMKMHNLIMGRVFIVAFAAIIGMMLFPISGLFGAEIDSSKPILAFQIAFFIFVALKILIEIMTQLPQSDEEALS